MIDLNGVVQAIGERNLKLYRTVSGIRIEGDCPSEVAEAIRYHQQTLLPFIASAEGFEQVAEQQAAAELGKCEDCGQVLVETLTFDGFLNLECHACDRCYGCRPSTDEVAARFAGKPEMAIPVVDDESQVIGEVSRHYQQTLLPLIAIAAGNSERMAEQQAAAASDSIRTMLQDFAAWILEHHPWASSEYTEQCIDGRLAPVVDSQKPEDLAKVIAKLKVELDAIDWATWLFPLAMEIEAKHAAENHPIPEQDPNCPF